MSTAATPPKFPENLPPGWKKHLAQEADKPYFKDLSRFLIQEYNSGQKIFPPRPCILRALQEVDYADVRVVLLGQDPYHNDGQAIGRCFAVPNEFFPKPPSLQNIFKEIESDLGQTIPKEQSDLSGWAKQGILLLNTVMTVRAHQAFSHRDKGWETFTDQVIRELSEREEPIVFILWGAAAQKKKDIIRENVHFFLESAHPSPLSAYRGFFGSRPFSKANGFLEKTGRPPIDWAKTVC
jgi:uracil-DNA glycosylase